MKNYFIYLILTLFSASFSSYSQYCVPTYSNGCLYDHIRNVSTAGGQTNFSNLNSGCSPGGYINHTSFSCSQLQGQLLYLNLASGTNYKQNFGVWIDWNGDNDFADSNETIFLSTVAEFHFSVTVAVPSTAVAGSTRMRIRANFNIPLNASQHCSNSTYGETEDYVFQVLSPANCVASPNAGTTVASTISTCPSTPFILSLTGNTIASGLSYQWQTSTNGISFSDAIGATYSTWSTVQSVDTYYRCVITCLSSGLSSISFPISVGTSALINCYCASGATNTANEEIFKVALGSMNNISSCSTVAGTGSLLGSYSNFTTTVAAPSLITNSSYPFTVEIGTCGGAYGNFTKAWIDYNQNGIFTDPGELVYSSSASSIGAHTENGTIVIPGNALTGVTRMRVVNMQATLASVVQPCGTYIWGETEDYFVQIVSSITCPPPSSPSTITADSNSATIQWVNGGTETQWEIQYGLSGFSFGSGTTLISSSNPFVITGLAPNSFYEAYIRAVCAPGDTSFWSSVFSWNTFNQGQVLEAKMTCDTLDFVDISTIGVSHVFASNNQAISVSLPFPLLYQGQLHALISLTNSGAILFNPLSYFPNLNTAIGPATLNGLYPFWDAMQNAGIGVYSHTIGVAPNRKFILQWNAAITPGSTNFVQVQAQIQETNNEIFFVYDDVHVGNPVLNNGLSATIGVAGPNQDIQLSYNQSAYLSTNSCAHFYYTDCARPSGFTMSYISPTEAGLSWSPGITGETAWEVIYGPAGFNPLTGGLSLTVSTVFITLPNLIQNTQYDVYIYAKCYGSSLSEPLFGTFLTAPLCTNPSNFNPSTAVDIISTSWSWTATNQNYQPTAYNLMYTMYGADPYNGTVLTTGTTNSFTINDVSLLAGGVYQLYIQAVCNTDTSHLVGPFTVTMPLTNDAACDAELLPVDGVTYIFNNFGATIQPAEPTIVPPITGAQTTNGWATAALNNTTWFKFVAPASGSVRINQTGMYYPGQSAVYSTSFCSDFVTYTLLAANDDAIGESSVSPNYTVCGLTPGVTYYLLHNGSNANPGLYAVSLFHIQLEPGSSSGTTSVCSGDSLDLFTSLTNFSTGGQWLHESPLVQAGISGSQFLSAGIVSDTYSFYYLLIDGCAMDSTFSEVQVQPLSTAGIGLTGTICTDQPIDLLTLLGGNVDLGGAWFGYNNQLLNSSFVPGLQFPGQYSYMYTVDNGFCPADTSYVVVNVVANCSWGMTSFETSELTLFPNPTSGMVFISSNKDSENLHFEVSDMRGRIVPFSKIPTDSEGQIAIDLSGMEKGVYFIRCVELGSNHFFKILLD
jgi:hypothetical protein